MPVPSYVTRHAREVWNAPRYLYGAGVSLGSFKAAEELGISYMTLIRRADEWGLTVYRHPLTRRRYFLRSEINELKARREGLTPAAVGRDMRRGREYAIETKKARR